MGPYLEPINNHFTTLAFSHNYINEIKLADKRTFDTLNHVSKRNLEQPVTDKK